MQETSAVISIKILEDGEDDLFWEMVSHFHFDHNKAYYERSLERHHLGELRIVVANEEGHGVGFCLLNWAPKYAYFKKFNIPEIQDLNVLRACRRRGIGRRLITFSEDIARQKGHEHIGIGVGLDASFGAAQRLYVRLGYVPDGSGVSYDRIQVAAGEFRPIDENLSLMMVKRLA